MADYSEFNNNNYLPGFYNDMETAAFNYHPNMAHFRTGSIQQNGFTFTSPTQCSTLATHRPCIQTTSPISISAPGVGTSWQHSIPATMPWVDVKAPTLSHPGASTATVFTGTRTTSCPETQLPSSIPLRCPKRKALDLPDEAPASKIYLCADQFANLKISPHEKHSHGVTLDGGGSMGIQFYAGADGAKSKSDIDGWQRFREIENRLEIELEEDVDLKMDSSKDGPHLKVAEGILESASSVSPILPQRVVEEFKKPCMQIVLWKSPSELIRDLAKEEHIKVSSSTSATSAADSAAVSSSRSNTNRMETSETFSTMSRDNVMDISQDTGMPGPASTFQPQHSFIASSPLATNFPALPSMVLPAMVNPSVSQLATSVTNNMLEDLDMFDSLDDTMQL